VPDGTWLPLTNSAPNAIGTMLLLPNGTVMAQEGGSSAWDQLTPDSTGSYINGTWSSLAAMSENRLYYASVVMPDGRVFVLGGEYSGPSSAQNLTNTGEIYNPTLNTWKSISNFPQSHFGDDPGEMLSNGQILLGYLSGPQTYRYDPSSDTYIPTAGSKLRNDPTDEESWVKLADGSLLSYDIFASAGSTPGTAQRYIPSQDQWVDASGSGVPVVLTNSTSFGDELGPAILLPDGRAIFIGANSNTAIYTPATSTTPENWSAGPTTPNGMGADDAPGALLPNGDLLYCADTPLFNGPTDIFDFNYTNNTITQVSTPTALTNQLGGSAYTDRMLVLPNGQMLFSTGSSQLWIYTPTGSAPVSSQPTISGITNIGSNGQNFTLAGTQITGMSEGGTYGDDVQMASNYPIVALQNGSALTYTQTSNWSTAWVQTGSTPETTDFQSIPGGAYYLSVSAAGISSNPVLFVEMEAGVSDNVTLIVDPSDNTLVDVYQNGTSGTLLGQFTLSQISAIDLNGAGGSVTLDYSNGAFGVSITQEGNGAPGDTLTIADSGTLNSLTYDATDAAGTDSGDLQVQTTAAATPDTINFVNLKGLTDSATVKTLNLNVDPGNAISGKVTTTFTGSGANSIFAPDNSLLALTFANPTVQLVVTGHKGDDHLTFTSLGTGFSAALTVNGNGGNDTADLNTALKLGSSTSSGNVSVTAGTINIGANIDATGGSTPGSVTLAGAVTVTASAGITYGGKNGLSISGGAISLGSNTLTLTDSASTNTATIGVQITGTGGGLTKAGPGALTLTNNTNNYTGTTTVSAGTLQMDGAVTSNVSLTGGTLTGTGSTGTVTGSSGGVSPGDGTTPGTLTTGALSLTAGSAFTGYIGGNTAGSYGQDKVSGGITLGGTLNLLDAASYIPQIGDEYVLLDNVSGTAISTEFVAGAGSDSSVKGTSLAEGATLSTNFLGSGWRASITYLATDGSDSNCVAIIISPVNTPPSITSAATATFTVGTTQTFTVTTKGYPAPTLSDNSASLPSGLTFQDQGNGTATISGNPAVGTGGTYSFNITAHNTSGPDAVQAFSLTVHEAAGITSVATATFTVGTSGPTFTVTTSGFPAPSLSDNSYTLPSGLTFKDKGNGTATIAGNPAVGTGGTYTFTITAHNGIGTDATQTFSLTVDEAAAITSAASATFTVGTTSTFTVTTRGFPLPSLSDNGYVLPLNLTFTDKGNGTATLSGNPVPLTGGTYTFSITAHNGIGSDAKQTFNLTVHEKAGINSVATATFTVGTAGPTFTVTTTGFPVPSLTDNNYVLPSGLTFADQGNGTATLSGTPALNTGGIYTFSITAHNGIGSDATQKFLLTVNEAAGITSAATTTFTVGTTSTFTVTTRGFPQPSLSDNGYVLPLNLTFKDQGNGTATLSGNPVALTGGTYTFTITAHNGIGSDATQTFNLTVDEKAGITSAASATFTVGTAGPTFTVMTTGFPAPSLSDNSYTLPSGLTFTDQGNGTATLSGTPAANTGGIYLFSITAHNGVGSDAKQQFTLTINQAPAVTSANNVSFIQGTPGSFTVTATGFPAPALSAAPLPSGVNFTDNGGGNGTLSSTASAAQGIYTFTITASNSTSTVTQTFTLTVGAPANITSANNAAFTAGTSGTFTVTATGFPAPGYSLSGAPTWVTINSNSGVMSVAPPATSAALYVYTITANNGVGNPATQKFALTINAPVSFNPAPAAMPPGTLNNNYNQTITAIGGTGNKSMSYSLVGTLPAGLNINTATNTLTVSGTPTALGTVTVDVTATDAVGASSLAAYTLRIVSVALVPDFLSPGLTMLVVATPPSDLKGTIITPVDAAGDLSVYLNGSTTAASIALTSGGTALAALPTGHILVYGNNGGSADAVHLKAGTKAIAVPAFLFGGTGNEILDVSGSSANNVLVGGNGKNALTGGSGRDILIGGPNYSGLSGGKGQDILLSGTTSYGQNIPALNALMTEWANTSESISTRETNLQNGGGANGSYVLNANTVQTDVPQELIVPGSSQNWIINAPFLIGTLESSGNLTFSWSVVNGAASYQLLLLDTTTGKVVGTTTVPGTSAQVQTTTMATSGLTVGHHYRWWITPVTSTNQLGVKSSPLDFVLT
jgi:autotransporter-associated beta strand protein